MPYKCDSCDREISNKRFNSVKYGVEFMGADPPCIKCGGSFSKVGSKYEKKKQNIEEELNYLACSRCRRDYPDNGESIKKITDCYECDEAVNLCKNCLSMVCPVNKKETNTPPELRLNEEQKEEIKSEITNKSKFD